LFYTSSLFCSKIADFISTQWFKIILIEFIGSSIKICCNLSNLSVALSRFILISNKKHRILKKFLNLRTSIYALILLLFSLLLSLFKVFEYKINMLYFSYNSFDFPYEKRMSFYCSNYKLDCDFFYSIKLANSVVNDFLILVANIGVDLFMFKYFGEFSIKKKQIFIFPKTKR